MAKIGTPVLVKEWRLPLQLPKEFQARLAKEFRFAADRMNESQESVRKLYFFSALHSEISRVLNWHWDRDLVLMHVVLQTAHQQLTARLQTPRSDRDSKLFGLVLESLAEVSGEIAQYVENKGKGQDLCALLGRVAELTYASTPHGGYVMEKKLFEIQ